MNKKRLLAFFMTMVMIISIIPLGTIGTAAYEIDSLYSSVEFCPLEIQVKTDKASYSSMSTAYYYITIKNISEKKIEKISAVSNFTDLQPISGQLYVENKALNPNESIKYSYTATIQPGKLNFFLMLLLRIKIFFTGTQTVPAVNFEDGRSNTSAIIKVKYGSVSITDKINVWYEKPTEVITTKNESEFKKEVADLVEEQMNTTSFDKSAALTEEYYSQRIIVEGKSLNKIDLTKYSPDTVIYNDNNSMAVIQCASQSIAKACKKDLNSNTGVKLAEVDTIMTIYGETENLTWGKTYIKADAYEHYLENNNYFDMITVAVVDSGVDMDHSYLKNRIASSGYDFVNIDTNPDDDNGHGTHVAGIIASCTAGLNVKILPIKVMDKSGLGSSYIIAQGIKQAANNGAKVINLSLGGQKNKILDDAVNYAVKDKNAVVCVAAGNGDEKGKPVNTANVSPACVTDAIVVAAHDNSGKIASFSNYGASVDVSAPGVNVYSTYNNGSYAKLSGTSMAAPHISAVAAMFKLAYPSYTPSQIETLVEKYCKDLGATGRDDIYGYGTVNMYNAIPDCTVKFNTNGGSTSNNQTVKSTDEITLPKPTKSYTVKLNANGGSVSTSSYTRNCTLEGWYKSSSLTGTRYAPGGLYMARNNETLYAKWTNPTLGAVNNPTRSNYEFLGWFTSSSGGIQYTSAKEITGNITLYAHWKLITFNVPNYAGWDLGDATNNLTANGMKYTTSYAYNNSYASGKVYGQSVTGNTARGNTIALYVSSGPKPLASGDWVVFNGGTTLYRTVAGGPRNGVYKADASEGDITGIYTYNGTTYYQFRYAGNSDPFGWAPSWAFTQLS